jgi:hypothetical protein
MPRFLREAVFTAALTVAVPVWAQVPITAEVLNRQELNRLACAQQPRRIAPPDDFIDDPVGMNAAALAAGATCGSRLSSLAPSAWTWGSGRRISGQHGASRRPHPVLMIN